jgi:hypothetical protein
MHAVHAPERATRTLLSQMTGMTAAMLERCMHMHTHTHTDTRVRTHTHTHRFTHKHRHTDTHTAQHSRIMPIIPAESRFPRRLIATHATKTFVFLLPVQVRCCVCMCVCALEDVCSASACERAHTMHAHVTACQMKKLKQRPSVQGNMKCICTRLY